MPRKPKPPAKSTPKTSNSYPNPLPPSLQSPIPPSAINGKSSSNSSHDAQLADWTSKNARAKAIIMSTLVPGSEPWQIAEPLEYAADIWKALEEKYGPKGVERDYDDEIDINNEEHREQIIGRGWQSRGNGDQVATTKDGLAKEVSDGLQEVAELWTHEQEKEVAKSAVVDAQLSEETRRWKDDSMRDQRFLWALLNGGKEEEMGCEKASKTGAIGDGG